MQNLEVEQVEGADCESTFVLLPPPEHGYGGRSGATMDILHLARLASLALATLARGLPSEAHIDVRRMVGAGGIEPPTPRV